MKTEKNLSKLIDVLNNALRLEYSLIIYYPRLASAIRNEKIKELVVSLGTASIKHADVVSNAIKELGGIPRWSFEAFTDEDDLVKIFKRQLEKEEQALQMHKDSAFMVMDFNLRDKLNQLAEEEKHHIKTVNTILDELAKADNK